MLDLELRNAILDLLIQYVEDYNADSQHEMQYNSAALRFLEGLKKSDYPLSRKQESWVRAIARESGEIPGDIQIGNRKVRVTWETFGRAM